MSKAFEATIPIIKSDWLLNAHIQVHTDTLKKLVVGPLYGVDEEADHIMYASYVWYSHLFLTP